MKMYAVIIKDQNPNLVETVKTFDNVEDARRLANKMNQEFKANGLDPDAAVEEVPRFWVLSNKKDDTFTVKECYDKDWAIREAKVYWDSLVDADKKTNKVYVLEWDGNVDGMDGDIIWEAIKRFQVDLISEDGVASPIDTIEAPSDYTADQYIEDCKANADKEWVDMLLAGTVELVEI